MPVPVVVHRYPDRVLLLPTMTCAATCRFCFRRDRLDNRSHVLNEDALDAAFAYIAAQPHVHEVILSGGDPLTLPQARLSAILSRLDALPNVEIIRIHTRLPLVAPDRITAQAEAIKALNLQTCCWVALHINHPDELTPQSKAAIRALQSGGMLCVSQSVLLAGVNDDADILRKLFRSLLAMGVKPYYLHQLDRAKGTGHFRVPLATGRTLMRELRATLSGMAQPAYILDIPGGHGKVTAAEAYVCENQHQDGWVVSAPDGTQHSYPPDTDLYAKNNTE